MHFSPKLIDEALQVQRLDHYASSQQNIYLQKIQITRW